MTPTYLTLCEELSSDIKHAYESSITMDEAGKLAAKFLCAQMETGQQLQRIDLDCRMKKTGLKAVKAAVYLEEATRSEKKPSDTFLEALVNRSELVVGQQTEMDEAEVDRDALQNYLNVFREAHIYFRGIAKGRFE